jgi:hypothetical protein
MKKHLVRFSIFLKLCQITKKFGNKSASPKIFPINMI